MRPLHRPRRGVINDALADTRTGSDDVINDALADARTESNDAVNSD